MNGRERIIGLLENKPVDRLPAMPITMMFAADRIGAKYKDYAFDYRVLVEGQIRTAEEFGFDHVSAISDPAREAADCGAKIEIFEDQPPALGAVRALLTDKTKLAGLRMPDPLSGGRMHDRIRAIDLLKERVGNDLLVEGWIELPCAEGADLRGLNQLMFDFFDDPAFVHDLFAFAAELALSFARAQIDAGVDIVGMGDAAASIVGPRIYEEFVWPYEKKVIDGIHQMGGRARLHICGHTNGILGAMGRLGCEIVDLDFPVSMSAAREAMGPEQVLLGNVDPVRTVRNGTPEDVTGSLAACHEQSGARYIVGAGCEIPRDTPPANVRALVEYAHTHTP